jgi:hypothetical protein
MGKQVTDYLLYRRRYLLGYSLIGLTIVGLLVMAAFYIPGGLSKTEMNSVVMSNVISLKFNYFHPNSIVNFPYHFLQRLSLETFGVSLISIKLPSLLLGLASVFGMLLLLRMWFRRNVAVLTTILVVTTGPFLFMAQNGTPDIIYIFWSVWLLVAAMMISRHAKWSGTWKIILFGIAALSLYTPLSLYILIALASATILHPHLRYLVRRLPKVKVFGAALCALVLISPLVYVCIRHPSLGLMLLGIPVKWPNLQANFLELLNQYFNFASSGNTVPMTPVYGLGSTILIVLGIIRLITTKYTARSYIVVAWIILLVPALIVDPSFASITFVPALLLMATGISMLITNWYKLFPRNPYARLTGLVPLAIFIGGMVFSGVDRYTYGYLYNPQITHNFSKDLQLVNTQLNDKGRGATQLVVSKQEAPFYNIIAHYNENVSVSTQPPVTPADTTIVSHAAYRTLSLMTPYRVVTDGSTNNSDRFYIYKTNGK